MAASWGLAESAGQRCQIDADVTLRTVGRRSISTAWEACMLPQLPVGRPPTALLQMLTENNLME